jgi:hypothetical protein
MAVGIRLHHREHRYLVSGNSGQRTVIRRKPLF